VMSSTLSHWEMLERPNLLMEPVQAPDPIHDLRMELALFRDMGVDGKFDPGCHRGP